MRISDWSSDVCSSDLHHAVVLLVPARLVAGGGCWGGGCREDSTGECRAGCQAKSATHGQIGSSHKTSPHRSVPSFLRSPIVPIPPLDSVNNRDNAAQIPGRSEEHTSELQSLMRISYAVFCLKKKNRNKYRE